MSRCAHVLCWQSALALSFSFSARARASPAGWHAGVGPLAACLAMVHVSATFDPQHAWAPFCDVICIRSIAKINCLHQVKSIPYLLRLCHHSSLSWVDAKMSTTLLVGQPSTKEQSCDLMTSLTSSMQVWSQSSPTLRRFLSRKEVLDLWGGGGGGVWVKNRAD